MKRGTLWAAVLLAAVSGPAAAGGNITGSVGLRMMDDDFWAPVEDQGVIGALFDVAFGSLPLHLGLGVQFSAAEEDVDGFGFTATGSVFELSAGVKLMPQGRLFRPFLGAGIVSTRAEFEGDDGFGFTLSDSDTSVGTYLEGGMMWRFLRHVDAGFNVRFITGTEVELFGAEGDADGTVITAIAGYGWGD